MVTDVDYLIIGAGQAGLVLYHFLAEGSKAIIDPRPAQYKLGESLIPEHFRDPLLAPLLEEARRLPSWSAKRGSLYIGDDSIASFPLPSEDVDRSMHLRREELEELMIRRWDVPIARERVKGIDFDGNRVHTDRRTWRVAKQILDCSGIARVVARARGDLRELWPSFSSWMYFDIAGVDDERFGAFLEQTGRSYARFDPGVGLRLPAAESYEGWSPSNSTIVRRVRDGSFAWQIPLYDKKVLSFGVTSRHGPIAREDLLEIGRKCIAPCYDVAPRPFDGSSAHNKFHVYNRFSRGTSQVASSTWILVGDAGFFGEPIYATGTAVAVNQALFLARALNDGGWTREKAEDYAGRFKRMVSASVQARRYFFAPGGEKVTSGIHREHGIEGTPFQLTMAQNYGMVLAGVNGFADQDRGFGTHALASAEERQRARARVLSMLGPGLDTTGWSLRTAYRTQGGVQLAFDHEAMPELTVRVERATAGRRSFREANGIALSYRSLPGGPYPMQGSAIGLVELLVKSFDLSGRAWQAFFPTAG